MGKIIAIIEKSEDGGYGIYAPDFKGLFGYGETEEEAKESLCDAIESQIEYYEENGLNGLKHSRMGRFDILHDFILSYVKKEHAPKYEDDLLMDL